MYIVFDFDNTLCDSSQAIISLYNKKYNQKIPKYTNVNWDFEELPLITKEDIVEFFCSKDFFDILQIKKGAKELIQYLLNVGHKVKIVSYSHSQVVNDKIKFIEKNFKGVEYEIIEHRADGKLDKSKAITKDVDLCVDDNISALESSNAKIKVLFGLYKYNIDNDTFVRATDMEELKEIIQNWNIIYNLGVL